MLVTRPLSFSPTGYLAPAPSHGSLISCFMPSEMRCVSGLKRMTCTLTCWPMVRASDGWVMRFQALSVVECLLEKGPGFLAARLVARQDGLAFLVLHAIDEDVDDVAFLHFRRAHSPVGEFAQGDTALGLEADIDGDEIVGDANDRAFDYRSFEAHRTAH